MAVFIGRHINRIDKKGRISVPKPFRSVFKDQSFKGIYVYPSFKAAALEACDEAFINRVATSLDDLDLFSDEQDDLAATILENTQALPFDTEGRVILPRDFLDYAGITADAAFVGRRHPVPDLGARILRNPSCTCRRPCPVPRRNPQTPPQGRRRLVPGHVPVMLKEVIDALAPRNGGVYVDGTFGEGGYSQAILDAAATTVLGIDRDPRAVTIGAELGRRHSGRLTMLHGRFGDMGIPDEGSRRHPSRRGDP